MLIIYLHVFGLYHFLTNILTIIKNYVKKSNNPLFEMLAQFVFHI